MSELNQRKLRNGEIDMSHIESTFDQVKDVLIEALGITDAGRIVDASTPLFGSMPEFDSYAVVSLVLALETRFGFQIDDEDLTADIFESLGSLVSFVDRNRLRWTPDTNDTASRTSL
jgi:acyl carrier protein